MNPVEILCVRGLKAAFPKAKPIRQGQSHLRLEAGQHGVCICHATGQNLIEMRPIRARVDVPTSYGFPKGIVPKRVQPIAYVLNVFKHNHAGSVSKLG